MATTGSLSWTAVRVAGESAVGGELNVGEGKIEFRPGKDLGPHNVAWVFESAMTDIADVATTARTLKHWPWGLRKGIRIQAGDGSQATLYLTRRARDQVEPAVANLEDLVNSSRAAAGTTAKHQVTPVDHAESAPLSEDSFRRFQRFSWLIGLFTIFVFVPEAIDVIRKTSGLERTYVLIYPGMFIAMGVNGIVGRFARIEAKNHPLITVLPLTFYFVGASTLAWVIFASYAIPVGAAIAPLLFGIPAALIAAWTLSPSRRRAWREARDNDERMA